MCSKASGLLRMLLKVQIPPQLKKISGKLFFVESKVTLATKKWVQLSSKDLHEKNVSSEKAANLKLSHN